jgi:enoyl-CoA hydratase/carnithine racemase
VIRAERDGELELVVLDRPEKRNALTPEMMAAFEGGLRAAVGGDARGVVLAGEGPVFCGGFDLKMCLERQGTLAELLRGLAAITSFMAAAPKPVVVAAHGGAIAGGCALLAAADLVVADEGAKIGYPVTPLGISPAVSAASLRLAVGDGWCRERLLDPALVSGREAARIGLVHGVVARVEEVRGRAIELARGLAAKPPGAFAATKGWMREIGGRLGPVDAGERALGASLGIAGLPEEAERLTRMFARK